MNRNHSFIFIAVVFLLVSFTWPPQPIQGQKKVRLKKGDRIQVNFLGEWYDAEVTEVVKQGVMLKATFTDNRGRKREGHLFANRSIRLVANDKPKEGQPAEAKPRKWTSAGGEFSIKATFAGVDGDKVKLKKTDGNVISVTLNSLSKTDNDYVKKIQLKSADNSKAENPFENAQKVGESDDFDDFDDMDMEKMMDLVKRIRNPEVEGVPKIDYRVEHPFRSFPVPSVDSKLTNGEIDFGKLPNGSKFKDLVFDRGGEKALASVRLGAGSRSELGLLLIDMTQGKILGKSTLPMGQSIVCDINTDGTMLLTRSSQFARDPRVDVWKLVEGKITHHASWVLPAPLKMYQKAIFACFTADDKVMTISKRGQMIIWEIDPLKAVAQMTTGKNFSGITRNAYQVSRDRKHFYTIINGSGGDPSTMIVIDLVAGKCVGASKLKNSNNSMAVSQSGERVAVLGKGVIKIFDKDMKLIDDFTAEFEGYRDQIRWIDERFLLVQKAADATVVDTRTRVPLWRYNILALVSTGELGNPNLIFDHAGGLWVGNRLGVQQSLNKHTLPHEAAKAVIPADPDSVLLFKKGMTISIQMKMRNFDTKTNQKIYQHYVKEFEQYGLKVVSSGGDLALTASTSPGPTRTTQYEVSDGGGGGGVTQSVTTQQTNLLVEISDANGVVWRRVGSSGGFAPPVVVLTQGQSLQDAVGGSFANAGFFLDMKFPKYVIRQPRGGAYGSSSIEKGQINDHNRN